MTFNDLIEINKEFNKRITYVTDLENYNLPEMWESAIENNNQGDCEDYSLAKLHELLQRGWPIETLRLTFCWVDEEAPDSGHAVLVAEFNKKLYVLDNRYDEVREVPDCHDYIWNTTQEVGGSKKWVSCKNVFSRFY